MRSLEFIISLYFGRNWKKKDNPKRDLFFIFHLKIDFYGWKNDLKQKYLVNFLNKKDNDSEKCIVSKLSKLSIPQLIAQF